MFVLLLLIYVWWLVFVRSVIVAVVDIVVAADVEICLSWSWLVSSDCCCGGGGWEVSGSKDIICSCSCCFLVLLLWWW